MNGWIAKAWPPISKQKDWKTFDIAQVTQEEIDRMEDPITVLRRRHQSRVFPEKSSNAKCSAIGGQRERDFADPQHAARNFWQTIEHPELQISFDYPGGFAKFSEGARQIWRRAPLIGEHNQEIYGQELECHGGTRQVKRSRSHLIAMQSLKGVKVVGIAAFAAGPAVGKHLADHGATVVHIESRVRLDGFRTHYPPYKDNIHGLNRSGLFALSTMTN